MIAAVECLGVERCEAVAVYGQGRDVVVSVLLALSVQNERLQARVDTLTARVARQDERIATLERQLGRSSRNSSLPPSTDPPGPLPRRGKDSSGRSQGAQSGHEGKGRPLLPAWAVDEIVEYWPDHCDCAATLSPGRSVWRPASRGALAGRGTAGDHSARDRASLRAPAVPGLRGARARAELPAEIAQSAFGPRFQAAVTTLSVRNRISRRDVVLSAASNCSPRGSARARWTRSSLALAMRTPSRTPICLSAYAPAARCTWTRPAGAPQGSAAARCGRL
jgi:transposase